MNTRTLKRQCMACHFAHNKCMHGTRELNHYKLEFHSSEGSLVFFTSQFWFRRWSGLNILNQLSYISCRTISSASTGHDALRNEYETTTCGENNSHWFFSSLVLNFLKCFLQQHLSKAGKCNANHLAESGTSNSSITYFTTFCVYGWSPIKDNQDIFIADAHHKTA